MLMYHIRSFVTRSGRITESQQQAFGSYWHKYGLLLENGQLDYHKIFARKAKINIEIGFGMGDQLLQMALAFPNEDFIGIEVHKPGIGSLLLKLAKHNVNNVRIYADDAFLVLEQAIVASSINRIMLFFPDPWPKRRHHKRRLVREEFVSLIASKLVVGGVFHVATDWQEYAEYIERVMAKFPNFHSVTPSVVTLIREKTKFELKGVAKGHKIWEMIYMKD